MATFGQEALTLMDLQKRYNATETGIDKIIEVLNQSNPIVQDMRFMEGNLPTGNLTTIRTGLPRPSIRMINRGVPITKSSTRQITDTCAMLEDRSEVDIKLLALSGNPQRTRATEDAAHIEGFGQSVAEMLFYGDTDENPAEFNGLHVRYNAFSDEKGTAGYQCINAGGTGNTNTTLWLVCHGDDGVVGIYPRGSQAGLKKQDLGEQTVVDKDGNKFQAVSTVFNWDVGLSIKDIRRVAAVRNVDLDKVDSAANRKKFIENIIRAKGRIRNLGSGRIIPVMYVTPEAKTMLEIILTDKDNVHVTRQEVMNAMPKLYVAGIEVKECEALLTNEAAIV